MFTNIKSENICRLCMCDTDTVSGYVDLFNEDVLQPSTLQAIKELLTIEISAGDSLPSNICSRCHETITVFNEFKTACLHSQTIIHNQFSSYFETEDKLATGNLNLDNFLHAQDGSMSSSQSTSSNGTNKKQRNIDDTNDYDERTIKTEQNYCDDSQNSESEEHELESSNQTLTPNDEILHYITGNRKNLPKLLPCDICGKLIREGQKMNEHVNRHNNVRTFKCLDGECDKLFPGSQSMMQHYRQSHSYITSPHQCEFCDRKFKTRATLRRHVSYHKEPSIPCTICGKRQYSKSSLTKHMMTHTGNRPKKCSLCPKAFQNNYNLKVHLRIHTKEKPYICAKCGITFGYNSLLKAHTEKHHFEVKSDDEL